MANIAPTLISTPKDGPIQLWRWLLANGDVGMGPNASVGGVIVPEKADKSIHIYGVFGVGGNAIVEGNNNPAALTGDTTWAKLRAPDSTLLDTVTALTLKQILEGCYMIRVRCSAGDGTTALIADLLIRGR